MDSVSNQTIEVHVRLLNEGTNVYRPTLAIPLGRGLYKLLATVGYDPEDEEWEFPPGAIVSLTKRQDEKGEFFVAIQGNTS